MLSARRSSASTCGRCDEHGSCAPSGECRCNVGWSGDGLVGGARRRQGGGERRGARLQSCADVNECLMVGICGADAICQNTAGSYQCVCSTGFVAMASGCIDVDECAESLVTCASGAAAECVNTRGGFECRCRRGYEGEQLEFVLARRALASCAKRVFLPLNLYKLNF